MSSKGKLYLVSVPIGQADDLSQRAQTVLQQADLLVGEEAKESRRLLKRLGIDKQVELLNEHTEAELTPRLITAMKQGQQVALFSDCGTPVFADPGTLLVQQAIQANIQTVPVPGASSLMAALVVCGFDIRDFYVAGFLPRDKQKRLQKIKELAPFKTVLVFYEAPYRLNALLEDLCKGFNQNLPATVAVDLTLESERVERNSLKALRDHFLAHPIKAEFVVILNNRGGKKQHKHP